MGIGTPLLLAAGGGWCVHDGHHTAHDNTRGRPARSPLRLWQHPQFHLRTGRSAIGSSAPTTSHLSGMVANGEKITCAGVIRKAPLIIAGAAFPAELFVMPLAGYDIVLGTKWLGALGPIVWDLANRRMSFQRGGHTISWAGLSTTSGPTVCALSTEESILDALLGAFTRVFATPMGLPPKRAHDHRILLKPDAPPVVVCPYRYPAAHKDELERQCAAMMEQGIVRHSDSLFSSLVLLVKKADGSWRFCVDYRALNAMMVKDAFSIPVVDELLDELNSAKFFSKLDLRSGYH
jgi:hypothetical protein